VIGWHAFRNCQKIFFVPEVLDAIKAELNRDLRPGRYVLAGSAVLDLAHGRSGVDGTG
jgi:hypothetical protein